MKPRGFELTESPDEAFPVIGKGMVANMLQLQLMPIAYRMHHPGTEIDMSNRELRNVVAQEWASQYASLFREYIEDHPREAINIHDPEALAEFFDRLREEYGQTLH